MGLNWAEHTVEIEAPIETCFEAITDYETFPVWQGAVVDTEVLDWDGKGRGKRVRLFIDAKVRKVDYTLDYRYDPPERIEWDFVEGNGVSGADGHYLFEDLGDRTRATYKLGLEIAVPIPGPVARRAHSSTLKKSVEDLKREAERRGEGKRASSGRRTAFGRRREVPPDAPPIPAEAATEERPAAGARSITDIPGGVVERGVSTGRRVTGGALRTTRDVAEGVAGAGFGVARRTVRTGVGVARRVKNRAARTLGRDSE